MDYRQLTEQVLADERYRKNIEFAYDRPHAGHPEGKVKNHIADLEANLERLKSHLPDEETYWKLKFLIHVHDTFKADEIPASVPATHPRSHESLAKAFASEFTDDPDLLAILQFHDENYTLWKQFQRTGHYDEKSFQALLETIHDWDLYLIFTIIDGYTKGKDIAKLTWFIEQVREHKQTSVDASWVALF
ncbi:MAG: hypothetical protein Fur0043_03350 [Anaerolineales bacterium]